MQALQPNTSYHIFNHANGFENVFSEAENYRYFLEKYQLYISPIAETYAYCLMPNHFHLVIRIRKREAIEKLINNSNTSYSKKNIFSKVQNFGKDEIGKDENNSRDSEIEKYLSKQFANLFSCYTQSFNKMYHRMGSLFIKNFKREPILNKEHFLNAVIYTHRNPIHHHFRKKYLDWDYCSYFDIVNEKSDIVNTNKVLKVFIDKNQFINLHLENLQKFKFFDKPENHDP